MSTTANTPKAVALLSPGWPPGYMTSGIVSYVGQLTDAFASQGRQAYVMSWSQSNRSINHPHVNLAELPTSIAQRFSSKLFSKYFPKNDFNQALLALQVAKGFDRLLAQNPCDLLETEESFGIAWFIQQLIKVPVVVRLHGPWFLNGTALGVPCDASFMHRNAAEKRAIGAADGVTSPSRDVLEAVRRTYDLPLPDAVVIPNAAPVIPQEGRWTPTGSDQNTVLFIGRFDRHKGGDLMIDAFNLIAHACPASRLVFVGPDRGLTTDSGMVYDLSAYIRARLSPEAQARIDVKGALTSHEIDPLRRMAQVTVVASRYETFCLTLAESLAYGCPTVASATGGIVEILQDRKTGLLCKLNDHVSLAEKVIELLRAPRQAAQFGRAAAIDMSQRFSPQYVANQTWAYYESVWERMLNTKRRRPPYFAFWAMKNRWRWKVS